ncbi:hypothetical protein ACLQ98_11145, partial [Avibacterium endocarditidis]|uniref:hypothetical protein n=1 Tax=Avibacterium endocarditidis TaxID=380674 RepID=UPI0039FBDB8D
TTFQYFQYFIDISLLSSYSWRNKNAILKKWQKLACYAQGGIRLAEPMGCSGQLSRTSFSSPALAGCLDY